VSRFIILLILLLASCDNKEQEQEQEQLYYIYKPIMYNFSFTLPEGWQVNETAYPDNCIEISCTNDKLYIGIFITPYENTYPYTFTWQIKINNELITTPSTQDIYYIYDMVRFKALYFNCDGFCVNMSFQGEHEDYEAAMGIIKTIREGIFYEGE
jgi:hypothetical protein